MLRDAAGAIAGATPRVTAKTGGGRQRASASLSREAALASTTHPQRAHARVASVAEHDLFAPKAAAETQPERARAAGSLLRRLRLAAGGAAVLRELELYRVFDVAASSYHTSMTAGVPAGHLVFVRQGPYGAVSLVIVGGRREQGGDAAEEFTLLVRGC
jgi:hypothetical protein